MDRARAAIVLSALMAINRVHVLVPSMVHVLIMRVPRDRVLTTVANFQITPIMVTPHEDVRKVDLPMSAIPHHEDRKQADLHSSAVLHHGDLKQADRLLSTIPVQGDHKHIDLFTGETLP
ncbi:hypothetical protein KDI_27580 [Dictyobacter arantiisoli]|uniref:Uncharacterized protein n=1 Tax=Dictyobacter arantiisoli TaxID=2014874 RepID=A0A5A5TE58_9CHLR|nr:hypothetical protein KDI_27580 [Dictyobacter arantiisoli]